MWYVANALCGTSPGPNWYVPRRTVARMSLGRGVHPSKLVWVNLGLVYFFWGSTYAGIAVAGESVPPFSSMGMRFAIAAVAMGLILKFKRRSLAVSRKELGSAAFIGIALLVGGTGGVALGEQTVPSGVTSLIICATPMWMILFRTLTGDRPKVRGLVGAAIGFAGMFVLIASGPNRGLGGGLSFGVGVLVLLGASFSWSLGSFISKRLTLPKDPFVLTMWEMAFGALGCVTVGQFVGEDLNFASITTSSWLAIAYLVAFGSLVAYSAYVWLLGNAPISLVATYAYVNPVVAVAIGVLLFHEELTAGMWAGAAVVLVGVALSVSAERSKT